MRKLLLLDAVLLAITLLAGMQARERWLEAQKRRELMFRQASRPAPPPLFTPLPQPEPLMAASYNDVAQQMLFSPDRNPAIIITPQEPKPMPALPVVYGMFNLGDGLRVIMSAKPDAPRAEFRPGQTVGEFKLVALSSQELELEWDGRRVTKKVSELMAKAQPQTAAAELPSIPRAAPRPAAPVDAGPGEVWAGTDWRSCVAGDNSPSGTIRNGWKKVILPLPAGTTCRWEPIK